MIDRLLLAQPETSQRTTAIAMLVASVILSGQEAAIQRALRSRRGGGTRAAWQRDALMRGAEVAVLGAAPPGSPVGRGRGGAGPLAEAAPCPTCPGARGGPGGARAFARADDAGNDLPPGGNQRLQGPTVKLTREPALARLAARDTGNLGQRATKVLARVEWTGKPGVAPPVSVAPLSAIEQQRFAAGRDLYLGRCQGCHNENGRGQPNLGPALAGSASVGGPSSRLTRIMLQGKEGAIGLMPPAGAAMTDEQVAAVLTYLRRSWDNTASPIDAASVGRVRTETSGRNRPWTEAELLAIVPDAR